MKVLMGPDPSQIYRPDGGKNKEDFRNYTSGPLLDRVYTTYKLMHTHQTVDFVRRKHEEFGAFSYKKMSVMEAVELLDGLVDESDPDVDFPNSFHAFQTAEGIRKAHPDKDWFHLVGLLHDLGKILVMAGEPQDNPDTKDPRYCTDYGMYEPHCGLENVLMSWGHDEYMYRMMKFNKFSLPPEAFYMIRFHSFYPWHTGGDYRHLCCPHDLSMLPWVQEFNKFDLYTKSEDLPDVSMLRPYYQGLIDKYCPGVLCW
ncbi:inositol oxygenase isoform X2 [Vombatus ursinus]|uniref:inositol oxygenase isoform X2 n=1 Tax=Vombatus ursinus TaxID=29139 RepID=UPI000FFD89CA|nr:inositol oxygenase isoform X2 [Vombatus ursinus]